MVQQAEQSLLIIITREAIHLTLPILRKSSVAVDTAGSLETSGSSETSGSLDTCVSEAVSERGD